MSKIVNVPSLAHLFVVLLASLNAVGAAPKKKGKGDSSLLTRTYLNFYEYEQNEITCNTVLTQDLGCQQDELGTCIRISQGATLDCNGYKIRGPGIEGFVNGIRADTSDGKDIKIVNCLLEGFETAIVVSNGAPQNFGTTCPGRDDKKEGIVTIEKTVLTHNSRAIFASANLVLADSVVNNNDQGLVLHSCANVYLDEVSVCFNHFGDISYNFGGGCVNRVCPKDRTLTNSQFIVEAKGQIRFDYDEEKESLFYYYPDDGSHSDIRDDIGRDKIVACDVAQCMI